MGDALAKSSEVASPGLSISFAYLVACELKREELQPFDLLGGI
jgi:hypothetical protein